MTPLAFGGLGVPELLIILAVVLLLFGGARLAGLGKSTGRALREFKEETKGLRDKDGAAEDDERARASEPVHPEPLAPTDPGYTQPPRSNTSGAVDPSDARRDV
jgi:sec-independent protein translocase protein TatA